MFKKGKKLLALVAGLALSASMVLGFTACGGGDDELVSGTQEVDGGEGATKIKVWVSELAGVTGQTADMIRAFNAANPDAKVSATIEGVTESDSATKMISDVETGADLFCFAQDQTARLLQAGALTAPTDSAVATIKAQNDSSAITAATVKDEDGNDKIVCYPLTSDNGYFMIYDKRYVKEESLTSLEKVVADCEAAGKQFSMELETSAWYLASFFFGAGCHSDWTIDEKGKATGIDDNFNSEAGVIAMKGMQILSKSSAHHSSSDGADFGAAVPSAVVVSGTWALDAAAKAIGEENLGYAPLPSFTVDGKTYHMGSYSGNKLMGVKPSKDGKKAAILQALAMYLTNKDNQLARFNKFGWGPSNLEAQKDPAVKANAPLNALAEQNKYATPQGQIAGEWWDIAKVLGTDAKAATKGDAEALKAALEKYDESLTAVVNKTDEETRIRTVIGNLYGDTNWTKDIPMVEKVVGKTWYGLIYAHEGAEFKVRKGKSWKVSTGNVVEGAEGYETLTTDPGKGNVKVSVAGLYIVEYSVDDDLIKLIPATLGVVGDHNSWGSDNAMTKVDGENAFISEAITFEANKGFKVRPNASWDFGLEEGKDGENFVVTEACTKKVKFTFNTETYKWEVSLVD